jgi:hypothetical protein
MEQPYSMAARPILEGQNRKGVKDINGKLFEIEFERVVQSRGVGWVRYMFPKPGQANRQRSGVMSRQ